MKKNHYLIGLAVVPIVFSMLAGCKGRKEAIDREIAYYKRHPVELLHEKIEECLSNMHGNKRSVKCEGAFLAKKLLEKTGEYTEKY